jgi:hypothetical protein
VVRGVPFDIDTQSPQREIFHEGNQSTASGKCQIQIDRSVARGKELEDDIVGGEADKAYMANVLTQERCWLPVDQLADVRNSPYEKGFCVWIRWTFREYC